MSNKKFWIAAVHRALWTFCETFIATIGTAALIEDVAWNHVLSASALAAIISVAKSVVTGLPEAKENYDDE